MKFFPYMTPCMSLYRTTAEVLKANPDLRIEVQGHTDSTGAAERNRQLSLERAQSVTAALVLYGVESSRLVPRGFGPDQPVADNADEQGRQQNRRVELVRIP
jgi:outer membrane protein OmpA-like peptidoglycan-associated protein